MTGYDFIRHRLGCSPGVEFAARFRGRPFKEAWNACPTGVWLEWLLAEIDAPPAMVDLADHAERKGWDEGWGRSSSEEEANLAAADAVRDAVPWQQVRPLLIAAIARADAESAEGNNSESRAA